MAKTYLPERQVEYWTSRQLEEFFLHAGYQISVFPLRQRVERYIPADHIFNSSELVKLFGIQYKALYHNSFDFWKLTPHQHQCLSAFDWIYYGLSDLKSGSQYRNSLHYLRIYDTSFNFISKFKADNNDIYYRWAMFFERLKDCTFGVRVSNESELRSSLESFISKVPTLVESEIDNIVDVFAVNMDSLKGIRISTQYGDSMRPA